MSIHLQKFVDRVRGFEARGTKDFTMTLNEAKDLHADITRLLIDLQNYREAAAVKPADDQVVTIQMDGGAF